MCIRDSLNTITPNDEIGSLPSFFRISRILFDKKGILWVNMPFIGIANLDIKKSMFATQNVYEPLFNKKNIDKI